MVKGFPWAGITPLNFLRVGKLSVISHTDHPRLLVNISEGLKPSWCSGSTRASKPLGQGSIPCVGAGDTI